MISGKTEVVSLIGDPVEHSFSPMIQNAAFKEIGLDYVYVAFRVKKEALPGAIEGIKSLELKGINITMPHKSKIIDHLDKIDPSAKKIGAVNTVKREGRNLIGFNTDGRGAIGALKSKNVEIEGRNILLLGAGGAGRAIAFTLVEKNANLTISNRHLSKAKNLITEIKEKTGEKAEQIPQKKEDITKKIRNCDILINSTSVGMAPERGKTLIESDMMHSNLKVMDIVYNPIKTLLLKEAEKAGAKTIDGLEMLVHQGAESFRIWTGKKAPVEAMKNTAKKIIGG